MYFYYNIVISQGNWKSFFYQNDQQKKLYKFRYERKVSGCFVSFWLTTYVTALLGRLGKFMYFNVVDVFQQ